MDTGLRGRIIHLSELSLLRIDRGNVYNATKVLINHPVDELMSHVKHCPDWCESRPTIVPLPFFSLPHLV